MVFFKFENKISMKSIKMDENFKKHIKLYADRKDFIFVAFVYANTKCSVLCSVNT